MTTKQQRKSATLQFLERRAGGALTLGRLLEAIRLGDEISQVAFARKLGISRSHLCDIEHGRKSVSVPRPSNLPRRSVIPKTSSFAWPCRPWSKKRV